MPTDGAHPATTWPDYMNPSEAVLWDIEKDPMLRSTITVVALLDHAPDHGRFLDRLDYASRVIPRLRQRVVVPPLRLSRPHWVVDPAFDLAYHVRRAHVPAPGTLREVLDLAQPLAMAGFDRARPLWEFTLVEGMEDGRAALIQKIHHTVTDGIGGIELAMAVLDDQPDQDDRVLPDEPAPGALGPVMNAVGALGQDARAALRDVLGLPLAATRAAISTTRDPIGSARRAGALGRSVARMIAPVPESASAILTGRSLRRRFETIDLRLPDMKASAQVAGGTVNDAFIAAVVEGLRRYHARQDDDVPQLRLTMPISLRGEGDTAGGNHFAPVRFAVPTDIADPVERMHQLGEIARRWQSEPALDHADAIASVLDRLPVTITTGVFGAMLKHVDAVVTNVPGIRTRSYLAGAEVERAYAFAPASGAAVNISLLSHLDNACVGVVTDVAAVPDESLLVACLVEGFDDVLRVADHHARRTA
jgi:WS/DGAT/MGAT family acyltransferase